MKNLAIKFLKIEKNEFIFAIKCAILSLFFSIIWLRFKIPMFHWSVYSSFIILADHSAGTFKKGSLRILSHIFALIMIILFTHLLHKNHIISAVGIIIVGFFILGLFIAGGENSRPIGTAGGVGFGIMLFKNPFEPATLEVAFYRCGIIVLSGLAGMIFDSLFFPVQTHRIVEENIRKIKQSLYDLQNEICEERTEEAINILLKIDELALQTQKYVNDMKFHPTQFHKKMTQMKFELAFYLELILYFKKNLLYTKPYSMKEWPEHLQQSFVDLNLILRNRLSPCKEKCENTPFTTEQEQIKNASHPEDIILHGIREQIQKSPLPFETKIGILSIISSTYQTILFTYRYGSVAFPINS